MLEVSDIRKKYNNEEILRGASFTAHPGDCIAITGCNGSGKSTMIGILAGLVKPDAGTVTLDGRIIKPGHPDRALGYAPQNSPLMEELSVKDNLSLWYTRAMMKKSAEQGVLKMLGIDGYLGKRVSKLSGGMKKRVSIAIAASVRPKVLLLDEPSAALDPEGRDIVHQFLSSYQAAGGTVVMVTHDPADVMRCTAGYAMRGGILCPFRPEEVRDGILY